MVIRKILVTLALAALALPSLAFAQHEHRATVVMRNGDRVAGSLEDVEKGIVYIRVSLHDQRQLGLGDVALIDLVGGGGGLPETELSVARHPEHLAVLRNGNSIRGNFIDITGGEATAAAGETHILHFRSTTGEHRSVPLDQVGRIYFGNFPGATTAAENTQPTYTTSNDPLPPNTLRVPGNATWVATPLFVRKGDRVAFNSTGRIQLSDDPGDVAITAGSLRQRYAGGSPLPQNFAGALIAKIGNSAPFAIGNAASVTMPADGQLYLGINDDEVGDNRGEFTVTLTHTRLSRR
jgi:hypothetical protein